MTTATWRFVVPNPGVDCWTAWTGGGLALLLIPVHAGEAYGYASSSKGGAAGADPAWLAQAFARFPTPARRAVEAASERGRAPYHSPVEEIRIDTWHRGPVVLVGDAAHATGPVWAQGAAAALEDALVLAEMLGSRSDWTAAVSAWELRRRPRVDHVQAATDRMSHLARLPGCLSHNLAPIAGPRAYRAPTVRCASGPEPDPLSAHWSVAHFAGEPLPGCPPGYADGDRELVPRAAAFARGLHGILLTGRVADRVTMAALGWRGGDWLILTADAGVMVARLAPFARCG